MAGSIEALLRAVPSKPNPRLPPIASKSSTKRSSSPHPGRIASISRSKLAQESSAKDPDLRRCIGHHRLFRRSIEEAHADMKRYMASVRPLDDDSDDDSDDEDDDFIIQPIPSTRARSTSPNTVTFKDTTWRQAPAPAGVETHIETGSDDSSSTTTTTTTSSSVIREQIANVVRTMIKRRQTPPPPPSITITTTTTTTSPSPLEGQERNSSGLSRISSNNSSSFDLSSIPGEAKERPTNQSVPSMSSRGRRYATRFGFRRRWLPSGPLQSVASC